MKTTVKKLSDTSVELTVSLDSKDLEPAYKKAAERLAQDVKVEGFRKGKVPTEVALKFIPENDLNKVAADIAVRDTVINAFDKSEKNPIMIPKVSIVKFVPKEMLEYTAEADVLPEIKLGDYKNLGVKREKASVKAADVNQMLERIAKSYAEPKAVKRAVKETDEVIIDFVGKKDGVAFNGGSAKDHHLVIGSHTFIPGFEEGIIGHEPGDKFDLKLTFPEDYGAKDLAGAKTVFEVLLKQVNEITPVPIDDELAKKCGPFKTLDALKADIKKNLEVQDNYRLEEKYKDDLITALVKKSKVTAPEIMIQDQLKLLQSDLERNALSHGMDVDEFLEHAGETKEGWEKQARTAAETRVKASLVLQILARDNKITVDDAIVDAKIAELKDVYKKSPEALKNLKDPNVRMDIKNRLTIEKTIDFLAKSQK